MVTVARLLPLRSSVKLTTSGSFPHMLFIATILLVYTFQLFTFLMSIPRLLELHRFYEHLLGIPDVRPLPLTSLLSGSLHHPRISSSIYANTFQARFDRDAPLASLQSLTDRSISRPSLGPRLLD